MVNIGSPFADATPGELPKKQPVDFSGMMEMINQ